MYQLTAIEKILLPLQRFIVELYNLGNMKMQIRDKNFKLIAERERPSKVKAPTTFIHTIRRTFASQFRNEAQKTASVAQLVRAHDC